MEKKLDKISPNENLFHKWMGWCDRVFHWIIGLMLLCLFAGLILSGTAFGFGLIVFALGLFLLVLAPFILIKLFSPGKEEPRKL